MDQRGLRTHTLRDIARVRWTPAWGEQRITAMIANRPDWCISRQRTWGVPLALFVHKQTAALHPRTQELLLEVAARVEQRGIDAWFALDPAELLGEEAAHYDKLIDVMDVWADSGLSFECVPAMRSDFTCASGSLSRGLRSAPRLVSQLAADVGGAVRARPVSRRADARLHGRREGPQDVQVARQRHRAAGHLEARSARTCCGSGSRPPTMQTR